MWKVKTKDIPVIIGGNWNRLKIPQKIPEQHTGRARNQGYTEKSRTELC
jgi:hypothetical protein